LTAFIKKDASDWNSFDSKQASHSSSMATTASLAIMAVRTSQDRGSLGSS
jgi:hypothetical protein